MSWKWCYCLFEIRSSLFEQLQKSRKHDPKSNCSHVRSPWIRIRLPQLFRLRYLARRNRWIRRVGNRKSNWKWNPPLRRRVIARPWVMLHLPDLDRLLCRRFRVSGSSFSRERLQFLCKYSLSAEIWFFYSPLRRRQHPDSAETANESSKSGRADDEREKPKAVEFKEPAPPPPTNVWQKRSEENAAAAAAAQAAEKISSNVVDSTVIVSSS